MILLLFAKLQVLEGVLGEDLWITRCAGSLMVSFKQPNKEIVHKYSLPCFQRLITVKKNGKISVERRCCARISVMPHVQLQDIELVLGELREPGAFPEQPC